MSGGTSPGTCSRPRARSGLMPWASAKRTRRVQSISCRSRFSTRGADAATSATPQHARSSISGRITDRRYAGRPRAVKARWPAPSAIVELTLRAVTLESDQHAIGAAPAPIVSSGNTIALQVPYQLVHGFGRGFGRGAGLGSGRLSGRKPPPGRPPPPRFGRLLEPLPPEPIHAYAEEGSKFAARRSETA